MIITIKKEYPLELIRWLVPLDASRVDLYAEIQDEIENNPDNILISKVYDKGKIQAIMIAVNFLDCVWLWQARCKPHFKYKKIMWDGVVSWAKGRGQNSIKTKTYSTRLERFFKKSFGFESQGDVLNYEW